MGLGEEMVDKKEIEERKRGRGKREGNGWGRHGRKKRK